jgi:hypothetical protein
MTRVRAACASRAHPDRRIACSTSDQEVYMSLTMILVIVLVIALLTGGGYYWRRW